MGSKDPPNSPTLLTDALHGVRRDADYTVTAPSCKAMVLDTRGEWSEDRGVAGWAGLRGSMTEGGSR